jgi:hypothetical protein
VDELVKLITSKTGLDEKTARQVADVVIGHLRKVLPPPLNQQVDKLISGQVTDISQIAGVTTSGGGIGGMLGKLFGGKK